MSASDGEFAGRAAVVTGAAGGIGLAVSEALLGRGARGRGPPPRGARPGGAIWAAQ